MSKIVASLVAVAALAVPSLALADNHNPREARREHHAVIEHRERDHRADWRRDHHERDRHDRNRHDCDRHDHGRRDWHEHGRR